MATIKVNSEAMRNKASDLKNSSDSIRSFTVEMTNEIDRLKAYWEGEAAETLVARFKGLSDDFEEIYTTVTEYASFLEQAADTYDATEKAITAEAEAQAS